MHVSIQNPPKPEDIAANMKRLGELGLQVQVTEMDLTLPALKRRGFHDL
ncbi:MULTISPECIES: endo-1,4-beta-xylanase [Moorena]|uniref:Glycosyl hydrolase family 10 n=1 Tax=Moorena producens 3L TaxID=489825 RepID=F4Y093_9CYAN|nr:MULTISPECIES: endo-1,4-beta-xylanase [Moorena]NEQ16177.1 hypothetical protein [Moorena sp. SIO3E2]EGJ29683.1 glycosyl hydrolase family 10 [Moorena producens 3L]NEP68186.1 hypothetical protein [Moorena sp. SIO3A5]NER91740.1 hypothetical protein [Moorena sp. SIO3A2]NES44683.1 hypothetical protein [Moorena sp. SIO2C4]